MSGWVEMVDGGPMDARDGDLVLLVVGARTGERARGREGGPCIIRKLLTELDNPLTPSALPGDYGLLEKMFGATSNNEARLAARQYGRNLKIDEYDAKKAEENKEWIAKYGYKRWGTSYMDKANLEAEQGVAAAKPAAKPAAGKCPACLPARLCGGARGASGGGNTSPYHTAQPPLLTLTHRFRTRPHTPTQPPPRRLPPSPPSPSPSAAARPRPPRRPPRPAAPP